MAGDQILDNENVDRTNTVNAQAPNVPTETANVGGTGLPTDVQQAQQMQGAATPQSGVTAQPPAQPQAPPHSDKAGIFRSLFETLAGPEGGYKLVPNVNTGSIDRVPIRRSKSQLADSIVAGALTGMFAGFGQRGPGATGRAFSAGGEAEMSREEKLKQQNLGIAQQDLANQSQAQTRKLQNANLNMQIQRNTAESEKIGQDMLSKAVDIGKYTASLIPQERVHNNGIPVTQQELHDGLKTGKFNIGDNLGPVVGMTEVTAPDGTKHWEGLHLVVADPDAVIDITPEIYDHYANLGDNIPGFPKRDGDAGKSFKVRNAALIQADQYAQVQNIASHYLNEVRGNSATTLSQDDAGGAPIWSLNKNEDGSPNLDKLADIFASHEGGKPGDRNVRNNNPGNLKYSTAKAYGITPDGQDKDGFAIFNSKDAGKQALITKLRADMTKFPNATPKDYVNAHYSPDNAPGNAPGQADAYANDIIKKSDAVGKTTTGVPEGIPQKLDFTKPGLLDAFSALGRYTQHAGVHGMTLYESLKAMENEKDPVTGQMTPGAQQKANMIFDAFGGEDVVRNAYLKETSEAAGIKAGAEEKAREMAKRSIYEAEDKNPDGSWNMNSIPVNIVEANVSPTQLTKRVNDYNIKLEHAIEYSREKYGVPYNVAQAEMDFKQATDKSNQNKLKMIDSIMGRAGEYNNFDILRGRAAKIPLRTQFPALNDAAAWASFQAGNPSAAAIKSDILLISDELGQIVQGGTGNGTSDAKIKQAYDTLKAHQFTKAQLDEVINDTEAILNNRKHALIGNNPYLQNQFYGDRFGPKKPLDPSKIAGGALPGEIPVMQGDTLVGFTKPGMKGMRPVQAKPGIGEKAAQRDYALDWDNYHEPAGQQQGK